MKLPGRNRHWCPTNKRDRLTGGRAVHPRGHFNRLIERKLVEPGGIKSLYSDSFCEPDEFWNIFDEPAYDGLRVKYDPKGRLGDLYRKCVLRE